MCSEVNKEVAKRVQCAYRVGDVVTLRQVVREVEGVHNTQQAGVIMNTLIKQGKARHTLQVHRRNAYLIIA